MVENSSSNSYAKTNSLLFDTLERGIKQEQANIELLTKKEKNIKSIITEEEKKNSKNNLPQVRKELERKLLFLKEELIKIKSKLKRKEDIFRHSQQTLSALKLERTMQYSKQNKLINDLEDKLQQLLNQKNNETKILLKEKEKHNAHINGIVKEKENIQRLIKLQEKSIDGSLKKDKLDQEKKVSIIEGELEGLTNKKRKITSEADLRSQALRLNIKKIKEIQGVVQEHFQKLEEHLAKKDFNFNDPIFAELIKEWRLRLGYFQETENKLEEVIKKKEISIKNSLKNMELKIVNLQTEKKRINDQYLNNQQKLAELSNLSHEEQELVRILEGQKKRLEYLKQQIEREKDKEHSLSKIIDLEKKQIYGQKLWQQRNFNREEENIANIKAVYDKQHHQLLKQNTSLDKELKEIQFQKEEAQRDFEKNRASLNKLTAELQELEQQLFLREKSSQEKTRMLLNEINLRQKEVQISEGKLKKMDVLINTVKRMSVESPEVLDSFKKEQKKIKLELNNLDINIINKKHEVEAINRLLENHKNIFLTKKNNILKKEHIKNKNSPHSY
ncbi:hypothetical protein J4437_06440 [Candidatus Woesearchaeota archaeon]|nr:hypothetical protein [Candidatus Woesearchaeota archaeon]